MSVAVAELDRNLVLIAAFLAAEGAAFVVVGGCALWLHGVDHHPHDLDIAPEPSPANLRVLFDALDTFIPDRGPRSRGSVTTCMTALGPVDVMVERGHAEYAALARRAIIKTVAEVDVAVATLGDVRRLRARFRSDATYV